MAPLSEVILSIAHARAFGVSSAKRSRSPVLVSPGGRNQSHLDVYSRVAGKVPAGELILHSLPDGAELSVYNLAKSVQGETISGTYLDEHGEGKWNSVCSE
jgi:hypothetical protein